MQELMPELGESMKVSRSTARAQARGFKSFRGGSLSMAALDVRWLGTQATAHGLSDWGYGSYGYGGIP